ncbi:MAG: sodium:calcium antiporter [Cyclobacteriaceae bacterium]|nr:MAG: sodium:calcium antiporter [Cyclobacteriaceae bacterium]
MSDNILFLFAGLFVLVLGGEFLVKSSTNLALRLRISPLVVGLTIVAFGTSSPELLVSINAALSGSPDLTMGNVIGSNICNLALVLGVSAIIRPIRVNTDSIKIDWPMTMGSSVLLYFLVREGLLKSFEGVLFIALLVGYTVFVIRKSRKENHIISFTDQRELAKRNTSKHLIKDIVLIILGCTGLFYGSDWFVEGAKGMALNLGVSERVIGITVLALGTSLPELVTASIASFRNQTDLALGNLMGSNIFNILSILGITSIIKEIEVSDVILKTDMVWMLGVTLLILPMMVHKRQVGRYEGAALLLIYGYYTFEVLSS